MSKSKDKFREFCKENGNIPLFIQDWWLDLVAGDSNWDVIVDEHHDSILSAFPYVKKKAAGFKAIGMPHLTPYMGFWYDPKKVRDGMEVETMASRIQNSLIDKLPPRDKLFIQLFPETSHNLKLNWDGYKAQSQHTYIIDDLTDMKQVYSEFKRNVKGDISKAKKNIRISQSTDFENFYSICSKTFDRIKKENPYDKTLMKKVFEATSQRGCGRIMVAEDENSNTHAAAFLVWDNKTTYYLAGGGDPKLRNSGATSLLIWEAIQWAATVSLQFDFEGSMIPSVEKFFQGFGPKKTTYNLITQNSSYLLQIRDYLKKVFS